MLIIGAQEPRASKSNIQAMVIWENSAFLFYFCLKMALSNQSLQMKEILQDILMLQTLSFSIKQMRIKLLCGASGKRIWLEILIMGASTHSSANQSTTYKRDLPFYFLSTQSINCTYCSSPWPACTPCLVFSSSAFFGTRCLERAPPSNTEQKNKVKAIFQKKISHAVAFSLFH